MSEFSVIARRQERVGRLTLNRPEAFHALNTDMVRRITEALLAESGAGDGREACDFFAAEYRFNTLIREYPKPYLAIMDGITMGRGVWISAHGSHRVVTANTIFAMPETGIGLFPDVGGSWFLPRLGGGLGMWLALSGQRLRAGDVLAAGIATHFIEDTADVVDRVCTYGLDTLEQCARAYDLSFSEHLAEIDTCFAKASVPEILACLDQGSAWAKAQGTGIAARSPLSLRLTHRQLTEGRGSHAFATVCAWSTGSRAGSSGHEIFSKVRAPC